MDTTFFPHGTCSNFAALFPLVRQYGTDARSLKSGWSAKACYLQGGRSEEGPCSPRVRERGVQFLQ